MRVSQTVFICSFYSFFQILNAYFLVESRRFPDTA